MTLTPPPEIDISIITYNSAKWIEAFFESLNSQSYPKGNINIYVTDNGSTDDTISALDNIKKSTKFKSFTIFKSTNEGFGHAHNNNFKAGSSDFILAANIDLTFEIDSILKLVSFAKDDIDNTASWEMRQKPHEHPKNYHPVTLETSWSSSACILFKRKAIEEIGGYDDVFFMYGEDVDLSWRMRAKGYVLKYCPFATCWHYTYSESKFKKIQFLGSLLGNLYLRNRFGTPTDIEIGEANYLATVNAGWAHYPEQKEDLEKNFEIYIKNKPHFFEAETEIKKEYLKVGKFYGDWDYEVVRDGAFYELQKLPQEQPLVSIIVRTYLGRDKLLKSALQSIKNQTYQNFEVLIIEDGGDSTKPVVDSMGDMRFRHISCEKLGRCVTGNTGLQVAKGEYIGFLDDDDLFFSDHIEVNIAALLSDKPTGKHRVAYSNSFEVKSIVEKDESGLFQLLEESGVPLAFEHEFSRIEILWKNILPIQSAIFHRSLYDDLGGFDEKLDNLEDWNLWTRYACNSPFIHIKKTTSLFRTPIKKSTANAREELMRTYYETALEEQHKIPLKNITAAEIREEIQPYKNEITRLNIDIENLRQHIDELSSLRKKELERLQQNLDLQQKEYHAILNSKIWRLTQPARRLASAIKKNFKN